MDNLIEFIDVLIWPITTVGLALLFRQNINTAFQRMTKFKFRDIEATFTNKLDQLEESELIVEISDAQVVQESNSVIEETNQRLERLVDISARAAIMEAWLEVEKELRTLSIVVSVKPEEELPPRLLIRKLVEEGVIDESVSSIYQDLSSLRNQAAHTYDFYLPETETTRYVQIAKGLAALLRFKKNSISPKDN